MQLCFVFFKSPVNVLSYLHSFKNIIRNNKLHNHLMHAKALWSCLTLCNPRDCSPPGSSIHGSLQARILEWVAISYSRGSSWPRDWTHVSYIYLSWQVGSLPLVPPGRPLNISHKSREKHSKQCNLEMGRISG